MSVEILALNADKDVQYLLHLYTIVQKTASDDNNMRAVLTSSSNSTIKEITETLNDNDVLISEINKRMGGFERNGNK